MDEYQKFLESQDRIYKEFEQIDIVKTGIHPKPSKGGIGLVYLKYPQETVTKLAGISAEIADITSGLKYLPSDIHTTIVPLNIDKENIEKVELNVFSSKEDLSVEFGEILSNRDSVILSGTPSSSLYAIYKDIFNQLQSRSLAQRSISMNHITVFRYGKALAPNNNQLIKLRARINDLSQEIKGIKVKPLGISIGWYDRSNRDKLQELRFFRF